MDFTESINTTNIVILLFVIALLLMIIAGRVKIKKE
jgi:hypothetical protein